MNKQPISVIEARQAELAAAAAAISAFAVAGESDEQA